MGYNIPRHERGDVMRIEVLPVGATGSSMSFAHFGGEGDLIILIHGLGGNHLNWAGVGGALTPWGRVVAPDLPGFGLSPPPSRGHAHLQDHLAALNTLVESLSPRRPVTLVGNSMGGALAIHYAATWPEQVHKMILVAPAAPPPPSRQMDPAVLARFAALFVPGVGELWMKRTTSKYGPRRMAMGTLKQVTADLGRVDPTLVERHLEMATHRSTHMPWTHKAFLGSARSLLTHIVFQRGRYRAHVAGVKAEVLVIQGEKDRLVTVASSAQLKEWRPDWTLEQWPHVGHVPQMEDPEAFIRRFGEFVGRG